MSVTFSHLNEADNSAPSIFSFFKFLLVPEDKKQKKDLEKIFSQESGLSTSDSILKGT